MSHLEYLNSLFSCLVVDCLRGRYRGTQKGHKLNFQSLWLCSGEWKSYPRATWASVEDDHTKKRLCPRKDCCIQETDGNVGPSPWYGVLSMHQANRSWWWWMVQSTSNDTLASWAKISFPRLEQLSKEIFCLYMTMPHPMLHEIHAIF